LLHVRASAFVVACIHQVNDLLYFFPTSESGELRFVWASEETGFRHLYLITAQVSGLTNGVEETLERMESEELYSSLLSSTLQFVRSKIMFQIDLCTNTFSQHSASSILHHFGWEIKYMQFFLASDNLEKKTTVIMEVILVVIEA